MNTRKAVMQVSSICLKVANLILIILGIIYLGQTTYQYTRAVFSNQAYEAEPGKDVTVKISEEITTKELAEILEKKGLIEDADLFKIQMKLSGFGSSVAAGEYELNSSMTPREIEEVLTSEKQ